MSSIKRKVGTSRFERRVRARREPSEDSESPGPVISHIQEQNITVVDKEESVVEAEDDDELQTSDSEAGHEAELISFGALLTAHASVNQPAKGTISKKSAEERKDGWEDNEAKERKAGRRHNPDVNRSNKHAPMEISSKKAVSRRREVVSIVKRESRDPRFVPLSGLVDESRINRAYSFLDEYREDEMKELKAAISASRDEDEKEKLKRTLVSMESRKKAQLRKDKEHEILDKHRKAEKELVRQGKQPYYLKKVEQKKRLLLEQYGELKGKQLDRVIERRRKKTDSKEKKRLPFGRREHQEASTHKNGKRLT